jgi:uncharacterized lipoprotein YehR (DUF1307 family)
VIKTDISTMMDQKTGISNHYREACMKKQARVFTVVLGVILVLGLGLAGCKDEDNSNPFVGTYTGIVQDVSVIVVITETTWESRRGAEIAASGTYTYKGNTATLKQGGETAGTGTLSGKSLKLIYEGGTYTLTKN